MCNKLENHDSSTKTLQFRENVIEMQFHFVLWTTQLF